MHSFIEKLILEEFLERKDLDIWATLAVHEYTSLHRTLLFLKTVTIPWILSVVV